MKPPYRVPSMSEIAEIPPNGLVAASTFSGCGGSSLGYKMAGYRVGYANEFVPAAAETYRRNHQGTHLDTRDVRTVSGDEILAACGVDELDLLDGSPPCASFSTAGKREKKWGQETAYSDTKQRVDDLFFEFARLVREARPRAFVAENVSGLVKGVAKGYFKRILAELRRCDYRVRAKVLDAQWLGVPQARQRLIFVGVRSDLGCDPVFPKPLTYNYTVRDALPHVRRIWQENVHDRGDVATDAGRPSPTVTVEGMGAKNAYLVKAEVVGVGTKDGVRSIDEPAPTVLTHGRPGTQSELTAVERKEVSMEGYAVGGEWEKLRLGEQSERYFNLVRPHPDRPLPTVTQLGGRSPGVASVTHPFEKRKFTIPELKRLCGFPDDFVLTGSYAQQWERLGRAVPPPMMMHVAETIRDRVFDGGR